MIFSNSMSKFPFIKSSKKDDIRKWLSGAISLGIFFILSSLREEREARDARERSAQKAVERAKKEREKKEAEERERLRAQRNYEDVEEVSVGDGNNSDDFM